MPRDDSPFNPYQAPAADPLPIHNVDNASDTVLASRGARLAASFIDGLASIVIVLPLQLAMGVFDGFPRVRLSPLQTAGWGAVGFVIWLMLHSYYLSKSSQTLGKRLLSIQMVDATTALPVPFVRLVLLRYLPTAILAQIPMVGPLLALIDILFIFGSEKRCIHDHIARTKVVVYPG